MKFSILPTTVRVQKTMEAVRERGVNVTLMETKESALSYVQTLIPPGASVMTGASTTLQQIGLEALLLGGNHPWQYLKSGILAEKDPARQVALRRQATLADYFLGSVHAIVETGELLIASATGSQLSAYAYSSSNIIWVAGTHKITANLDIAFQRMREYALPLEDQHLKKQYGPNVTGMIGKILVFEREASYLHRNISLVLVNEVLGF